jgi:hypothetical protein
MPDTTSSGLTRPYIPTDDDVLALASQPTREAAAARGFINPTVANGHLSAHPDLDAAEDRLSAARRALRKAADIYEATARADDAQWCKMAEAAHAAAAEAAILRTRTYAAAATADRLASVYAVRNQRRGGVLSPAAFDPGAYAVTVFAAAPAPVSEEDALDARARSVVESRQAHSLTADRPRRSSHPGLA